MDNQKITTKSKPYFKTLNSIKKQEINDVEAAIKYTKYLHEDSVSPVNLAVFYK